MITYIADIIACGLVVIGEMMLVLIGMALVQFIFYKVFKINIYKLIFRGLDNLDKYLTTKLG